MKDTTLRLVTMIKALIPQVAPATIEGYVSDWLDLHPEATTTVEDGSITMAKLASSLASTITSLSEEIADIQDTTSDYTVAGCFANLVYNTLGLYVDADGDIAQREDA